MTIDSVNLEIGRTRLAKELDHPLADRVPFIPRRAGVYMFVDQRRQIIYVGKAAVLRSRIGSYFGNKGGMSTRLRSLLSRTVDLEFIVTDSDKEALLLEANLIKQHRPRYNIQLRDDKTYLYLKITHGEPYPRVYTVRHVVDDEASYFGPYTDAKGLRTTIAHLQRVFQFRTCGIDMEKGLDRPCLLYHIKRCLAPCIRATTPDEYSRTIDDLVLFVEGKQADVLHQLEHAMAESARTLEFERAAAIRDRIVAAKHMLERQRITATGRGDIDAIAFARDGPDACVQVFQVRSDKVISRVNFVLQNVDDSSQSELLTHFIQQYYLLATVVPAVILLPIQCETPATIESWLSDRRGKRVLLKVPQRGNNRQLIKLASENAMEALEALKVKWLADERRTWGAVLELAIALELPAPPRRIECYDISNIQGALAVGSMVVFERGRPHRDAYRRFRIKTVSQSNDFAMIAEVIDRRFRHTTVSQSIATVDESTTAIQPEPSMLQDNDSGDRPVGVPEIDRMAETDPESSTASRWDLPELVIIDGGKGQLNAALNSMREACIHGIPVIGLAKDKEEIFRPKHTQSLQLPPTSQALYLIQRIRDEAHRFAVTYHRGLRRQRSTTSALDQVPGIGPKRKRSLLQEFGSVQHIRDAHDNELIAVKGMTKKSVKALREHL